jgi:hypothetical protein
MNFVQALLEFVFVVIILGVGFISWRMWATRRWCGCSACRDAAVRLHIPADVDLESALTTVKAIDDAQRRAYPKGRI